MNWEWLYNPYTKIAGYEALLFGVIVHILIVWLSYFTGTHIIGYSGLILAADAPFWFFHTEMAIHAVVIIVAIGVTGLVLAGSRFRWLDVMGTVLLSRVPLVLTPLARLLPPLKSFYGPSPIVYLITFIFMGSVIWSIALLYHAFKVSCNPKSRFTIIGFIGAIILSEVFFQVIIKIILS